MLHKGPKKEKVGLAEEWVTVIGTDQNVSKFRPKGQIGPSDDFYPAFGRTDPQEPAWGPGRINTMQSWYLQGFCTRAPHDKSITI